MILFELVGDEGHAAYQELQISNGTRQYDFLRSIFATQIACGRDLLSAEVIKALNFHAIACMHVSAGAYRPCDVHVGNYQPPRPYQVAAHMEAFIDLVNRNWVESDPIALAAFVLWQLNAIHPFINGNGRTARVACLLVLCLKLKAWLPGRTLLPELLKANRPEYVKALKAADGGDLTVLHGLLSQLLQEQINSADLRPPPRRLTRQIARSRKLKS